MITKFWTRSDKFFWIESLLIFLGFFLTVLSYLHICTTECAEVHFYKIYGFDFELAGFLFFIALATVHALSYNTPQLSFLTGLMVAGAVGSEVNFILVQKYTIGMWCPLCLTIASTVGILALTMVIDFFRHFKSEINQGNKRILMQSLWKGSSTFATMIIGFIIAFLGVAKPQPSFAEDKHPVFGNQKSAVEVFIVTDWLCPACRHMEPIIDQAFPDMIKEASVYFVDKVIHPESMNFVPYNVSFMVNNKDRYLETRQALHLLSDRTHAPTLQDVEEALRPMGIKYRPLNFADVNSAIQFFEGINKTFEVRETPTIVIANRKSLQAKKLVGREITKENMMHAIEEMKKK